MARSSASRAFMADTTGLIIWLETKSFTVTQLDISITTKYSVPTGTHYTELPHAVFALYNPEYS